MTSDARLTTMEQKALRVGAMHTKQAWFEPIYEAVEHILAARAADSDAATVAERTEVILKHTSHLGAGGNLWNAKCLGCEWRDGGRGDINFAARAHARHLAAALTSAGDTDPDNEGIRG